MKNLKLAHKLGLSFFVMMTLNLIMGIFAVMQMQKIFYAADIIGTDSLPSIVAVADIQYQTSSVRRLEAQMLLAHDPKEVQSLKTRIEKSKEAVRAAVGDYKKLITDKSDEANVGLLVNQYEKYFSSNTAMVDLFSAAEPDMQKINDVMFGESRKTYTETMKTVDKILDFNKKEAASQLAISEEMFHTAKITLAVLILLMVIISTILAIVITKMISAPIRAAMVSSNAIAAGDLTQDIIVNSSDESGKMLESLHDMQKSLVILVSSVRTGAEGVSTASSQIAAGNHDLSSRTESQASALQETAASMEQLSATVTQNADSAANASELARKAVSMANDGGKVVNSVVATMSDINNSSKKITEIISVIDGIAFQTNILALNAAVEAARAGDAGRGFAVVATEVRNLAGRSATAAKEIKTLIETSVNQVTDGMKQAADAGTKMNSVVDAIQSVATIVGEISNASREQAAGVSQVGEAVTQMDQVTQQNAALVEEMAAAASSLKQQAEELVNEVSIFRI